MPLNAREHLSLLKESLNWLYERGTSHVELSETWSNGRIRALFEKLGNAERPFVSSEPTATETVEDTQVQTPKHAPKFGEFMKVFGDGKSTGRQRSHTPVENQPKGPTTVAESMPTFEPSELGRFVEAFCQKEGIVDAEIARSMTRVLKYEHLKNSLRTDTPCPVCSGRQRPVLPKLGGACRVIFVSDQPEPRAMLLGTPFVGTEGDLVARMASAMGLAQEHVSYAYLNPCAHDEAPVDEMARHWLPFFQEFCAIAEPEAIIAFGETVVRVLTEKTDAFPHLRGQWFTYRDVPVMCTFHPSALLQHPPSKAVVWEDLKSVMRKLGLNQKRKTGGNG